MKPFCLRLSAVVCLHRGFSWMSLEGHASMSSAQGDPIGCSEQARTAAPPNWVVVGNRPLCREGQEEAEIRNSSGGGGDCGGPE